MNQRVKDLSAAARKLTPDELAKLVDELLLALHEADPSWDKAWAAEAQQRIEASERKTAKDRLRATIANAQREAAENGLTDEAREQLLADES